MKKISPPQSETTKGDIVHIGLKSAFGLVPFAGGALAEAFELAVTSPAEKRVEKWISELSQVVNELVTRFEEVTPERLGKNEAFTTTVIATSRIAMLTESQEKLSMLKSAVLQTGSGVVLSEVVRNTFLEIIARYSPEHVIMLRKLNSQSALRQAFECISGEKPEAIGTSSDGSYIQIEKLAPSLLQDLDEEISREIFSDLHRDRLCRGSEGFAFSYSLTMETKVVTKRGMEFLNFVSET